MGVLDMSNSISPGYVKLFYDNLVGTVNFRHTAVIPVTPEDEGGGVWTLQRRGGGTNIALPDAMDEYVALVKGIVNASTTFTVAELWSKPTPESDPMFIELYEIGVVGTDGGSASAANQMTLTFRSTEGGTGRTVVMGTVVLPNQSFLPPSWTGATGIGEIADYVCAADTWVTCRDGGFAYAPIRAMTKTNDVVRRKFL